MPVIVAVTIMGTASTEATGRNVELELQTRDRGCFFVEASDAVGCRVTLEHFVNRSDGRLLEYFTIEDVAPDRVLSMAEAADGIADVRIVGRGVDEALFEFIVSGACVTTTLADTGAVARSVSADSGVGHVVADVPAHVDTRTVVERFREAHPDSELLACRDADGTVPVRTSRGARAALADRLTDKQLEVLRTAYLSGYFCWPRESSAEECADALGITQPTFSQHIRAAQARVMDGLFDGDRHASVD
jgi:predicted DNA binding protein